MNQPPLSPPGSPAAEVRATRGHVGFTLRGSAGVLEVRGPDHRAFLQAQLPADLTALDPGRGCYTARLDNKGRILADFVLAVLEDRIWILASEDRLSALAEDLERYHILESLTCEVREDLAVSELHGPGVPEILAGAAGKALSHERYHHAGLTLGGVDARFLAHPWSGETGGRLIHAREAGKEIREALAVAAGARGLAELSPEALEILRIEGGTPRYGVDIDQRTLLPELGREDEMVSYTKGCFLGQETVARIHSRGHVNKLLRGLLLDGDRVPEPGTLLVADGTPVGEIRSAVWSPSLERVIALGFVRRGHLAPGAIVHAKLGGEFIPAEVRDLPLYRRPGPEEQAVSFYRRGLDAFQQDRFADAERLFERALLMNPGHFPALESLGIAQERQGRVEEAIDTMQSLADSDPDNVMAWTNLSRYFAQQGKIAEAEDAKGRALSLSWKAEAGEAEARQREAEQAESRRRELEERVGLFRQVLEMDPEDVIANFGLGKILLDLGRHQEAEPLLRRAVELQEDYSTAYSHLAAALLAQGKRDAGREVLIKGIAVAGSKGDLMPQREMERRLAETES